MKVILGLGNPGREYEQTRHNVGWWVLDHLADVWHFDPAWTKSGDALVNTGVVAGLKVRLVKPLTYMNLSGEVLRPWLRRPFWAPKTDLLVVVDEVAIPLGTWRLRARGSAGGHNGLKSIEHHLKSQEYPRLRIGIRPEDEGRIGPDLAAFVLGRFDELEARQVRETIPAVVPLVETWIREGTEVAMNRFNGGKA